MDSYIVRVYRRSSGSTSEEVAGLVEEVGTNQKKSFQTVSGMITTIRQVIGRSNFGKAGVYELNPDKGSAVNE
jgi:hypothetical protein